MKVAVRSLKTLHVFQIDDPLRQVRDTLQERQPILPKAAVLRHHEYIIEENGDRIN